jgi:hypothetical protein
MKLLFGPFDGREIFVPSEHNYVDIPLAPEFESLPLTSVTPEEYTPVTARYVRTTLVSSGAIVGDPIAVFVYQPVTPIEVGQVISRLISGYRGFKPGRAGE